MATILVVDDEIALLELLEGLLDDLGHQTFSASDGQQALGILEAQHVDLVISDIMMPVMDGITLLRHMRENEDWKDIKIVLMSAAPPKLNDINPDKFLPKPYDIDEMEALVAKLLDS
jgi:CheY-like chemotaxis protein